MTIKMLRFIALTLLLCFQLSAAESVVLQGFFDQTRFLLNPAAARIAGNGSGFQVDTRELSGEKNWLYRSREGVLKPNTEYTVTFRYRINEPEARTGAFVLLVRPLRETGTLHDKLRNKYEGTPGFREVNVTFQTGDQPDYALQIYARNKVRGEITAFKVTEKLPERYIPALVNAVEWKGDFGKLPVGSREFEVQLPRPTGGAVVHAAEFGVSEQAPDNIDALNRAIVHCRETGASKLVWAPGVYRMTVDRSVLFENLHDFEFDGNGATLVFLKKRTPNFRIVNCERVVFRNFNHDWDWERDPLFSLVECLERTPKFIDFKFIEYDRFPRRDLRVALVSSYDATCKAVGQEIHYGRGFEFNAGENRAKIEWLSDNVLRIYGPDLYGDFSGFKPGKLYRMQHYYYDMGGIFMNNNRHLTLEDVNLYSNPGHAFAVSGQQQYWQFRRVRIAPPENVARRPGTCTADHLHIYQSCGFLKIEDCEFGYGADDFINVHESSSYGKKRGPFSVEVRNASGYVPGAEVEFRHWDYSPAGIRTRVKEVKPLGQGMYEIRFADSLPEPLAGGDGFILFNWTYDSRNIIIRNNYFHRSQARGLLLLGRDITVENNRFYHTQLGAIKIETGYTFNSWSEGYGASNIVIRNNIFDTVNPVDAKNDGKARDIFIGVYMKTDPSTERTSYPILSDILFENNTFRDSFGLIAFISSAGNVTFRNNTFLNPGSRLNPLPYRSAFFVTHAQNVKIVNNIWEASPNVPNPGVFIVPDTVQGVIAEGNQIVPEAALPAGN